jgi:hypothetical protein
VILNNLTVQRWVQSQEGLNANLETGKLVACLEVLRQHYASQIREEQDRRYLLPPEED